MIILIGRLIKLNQRIHMIAEPNGNHVDAQIKLDKTYNEDDHGSTLHIYIYILYIYKYIYTHTHIYI